MSLLGVLIILVTVGILLYILNTVLPMGQRPRIILNAVVALALIVWLLNAFGVVTCLDRPVR